MSHGTLDVDPYPRGTFAAAVGWYVACLVVPGLALAIRPEAATATLAFVAVAAGVALPVARRERWLAGRLGNDRRAWTLVAPPFGYAAWLAAAAAPGGPDSGPALLGLAGGAVGGLLVVTMADNRAVDDRVGGAAVHASWRARPAARRRRLYDWAALACVAVGATAFVLDVVAGVEAAMTVGSLALPMAGGLYGSSRQSSRFQVVDGGLVVRAPVHARLWPWRAFDGVEATGDAVVLRTSSSWVPDRLWDHTDIEDPDAVVAALRERVEGGGER